MKRKFVIAAAGGNGTAIEVLERPLSRAEYATRGAELGIAMEKFGAEQAGFLIPSESHFEMGGGEFCGNAARSAAILLSEALQSSHPSFTMSGYGGTVKSIVEQTSETNYYVSCFFPGLKTDMESIALSSGRRVAVVDLGGIVHVVLEAPFPVSAAAYQAEHKAIVTELDLASRSAVGVVWIERVAEGVSMRPVVWVKDVNTFFYEHSCGSGTIAVSKVTGAEAVIQPTGQMIEASITPAGVMLKSAMEVVHHED